ncbi:MAG: LLM class flavin-dependent oxidoreductase [Dehalococcoidia bacterium]
MEIGVGLPVGIPGITGPELTTWARRGEEFGFSSLAVIDRLVFDNHEPLATLAAAAAVTERVRLATTVLLAPLRTNTALLAKQAATVDSISGGRLVLGLGIGGRPDDFEESGADIHRRGRTLDRQLAELKRLWAEGSAIGPRPVRDGGPELIVGGHSPAALARAARHAAGWIAGAGGVQGFSAGAGTFRSSWADAGRTGSPRLLGLSYFALGSDAERIVNTYIPHYYGELGARLASLVPTTPEALRSMVADYADAGCDELMLLPCSADRQQLELLGAELDLPAN